MGNCQAAEAASVLIQHPSGRVERVYWSLTASQVMASNPGHYVAVIITAAPRPSSSGSSASGRAPVKHLKLLRPDDTLHIGHVYRLVSFEGEIFVEVLREFASKKHVKLSKLLVAQKEKESRSQSQRDGGGSQSSPAEVVGGQVEMEVEVAVENGGGRSGVAARAGQWRPALQSIAEIGS